MITVEEAKRIIRVLNQTIEAIKPTASTKLTRRHKAAIATIELLRRDLQPYLLGINPILNDEDLAKQCLAIWQAQDKTMAALFYQKHRQVTMSKALDFVEGLK